MEPAVIAACLRELATYYELDRDAHRARAYDGAARAIEAANGVHRLLDEGRLEELPGIGPSTARVIGELARRGTADVLDGMRARYPAVVLDLARLPKVGVLKARAIVDAFAPVDLDAVAALARAGALRELPRFGKLTEAGVLHAIENRRPMATEVSLVDIEERAHALVEALRPHTAVERVELAGPVRRWCEVIDHLAYVIATRDRDAVVAHVGQLARVIDRGGPNADAAVAPVVAQLADGLPLRVHVVEPARFGWAHIVATGSDAHVAQLRARARDRDIAIDTLDAAHEHAVYAALGLPWLPPEVRDATDELAAADAGETFTDLVVLGDVTTAFHCHTTYSDGRATIAEMAEAAAELGFAAITITDHSAAASYASGLDLAGLRAQRAEIDALAAPPARILHGTEADILEDGAIDVPFDLIGELDVVIASVHQRYKLDEARTTARVIAAMRAPFFKIWGHALGRLVLRRAPVAIRLAEVLDVIAESPAAIELNGDPHRLDLEPVAARAAAARGIKFVLSSDAHSTRGLAAVRYAVAMARRARLRKREVLNTLPPAELAEAIRPRRA